MEKKNKQEKKADNSEKRDEWKRDKLQKKKDSHPKIK